MAGKEDMMVWKDDSGTYKLGYSQFLQQEQNKLMKFLLIVAAALTIMLAIGGFYAFSLVERIDAMNVVSHLAASFLAL